MSESLLPPKDHTEPLSPTSTPNPASSRSSSTPLLGDLDTANGAQSLLHVTFVLLAFGHNSRHGGSPPNGRKPVAWRVLIELTVDGELEGSQGTNHEQTSADTSVRATETKLFADLDQAGGGALTGQALGLVDLGQHGVGGLRDDGGGETGNQTGAQVDGGLHALGHGALGLDLVDGLGDLLVDDELGAGVRNPGGELVSRYPICMPGRSRGPEIYVEPPAVEPCRRKSPDLLLEQNRAETSVESTNTLLLQHLAETADQTRGVGGLGDETNTGGLEGAEGNVGEELGGTGGGDVDQGAVVGGILVAEQVDGLLLEELVSSELEGTLQEVTGGGRAQAGQKSAGTLSLDDLLEATDHAPVVGGGVELDTGLDARGWPLLAGVAFILSTSSVVCHLCRLVAGAEDI